MTRAALLFGACVRVLFACMPVGEMSDAASVEGGGGDADGGDAVGGEDAGPIGDGCSNQQSLAYRTVASGTVAGSDVSASFCGALAWLYVSPYSTPPNDVLLFLDSVDGAVHVDSPSTAIQGMLSGMMQVGATSPGVYTSASACGFMSFTYWLSPPPTVDCADASGPYCPTGCSSVCFTQGCSPCQPVAPEVFYRASGVNDCSQSGQASTIGTWIITLTSVVPYTGEATNNGWHYIVHGSVVATLPNADGFVKLTATF